MSDGTINLPVRTTPPDSPNTGRYKIWVASSDGKPRITDENGVTKTFETIYGSEYFSDEAETIATNNSTTLETYLSVVFNNIEATPTAKYVIECNIKYNHSSTGTDYRGQILVNGSPYKEELRVEPKDSGADQRIPATFKFPITGDVLSTAGNISFAYRSSSSGNTARTYYCFLELIRVA